MSAFTDSRKELAESLEGNGYIVYPQPFETMQVPSFVLVPDSPYLEPTTLGRNTFAQHFKCSLMVPYIDNQAALLNLESMIEQFLDVLPTHVQIDSISAPSVTDVGPSKVLAVDSRLTVNLVKE
mgnify:CR=1 FL=1